MFRAKAPSPDRNHSASDDLSITQNWWAVKGLFLLRCGLRLCFAALRSHTLLVLGTGDPRAAQRGFKAFARLIGSKIIALGVLHG